MMAISNRQSLSAKPIPPRVRLFSTVTPAILVQALFITAAIIALFLAWYHRDLILWRLRGQFSDDIMNDLYREMAN